MADTSENARLQLKVSKKNKIIATLFFTDTKKSMPLQDFIASDTSLDKADVNVFREDGHIVKVIHEDKVIYDKSKKDSSSTSSQQKVKKTGARKDQKKSFHAQVNISEPFVLQEIEHSASIRTVAHAPYNFVPLNKKEALVTLLIDDIPEGNKYHYQDRNTGWIDVTINTQTPLYIRGTLSETEVLSGKESTDKPDFFSPAGTVRIPGSSLRGMIRALVEIVSFGNFNIFDDKRLYYRAVADMSNLRDEYNNVMSNVFAGTLRKKGLHYYIRSSGNFEPMHQNTVSKLLGSKFKPFSFHRTKNNQKDGFIVISGPMKRKQNEWWIDLPTGSPFQLNKKDIVDYQNDKNRSEDVPDLLKLAEKSDVPCFYAKWTDKDGLERTSFGHTKMFRLPYQHTIGEHVPHDNKTIDIPEAIFGNEKRFAGRVFFEDAHLVKDQTSIYLKEDYPKILSSPKPTTFQHYLVQTTNEKKYLNHYNSPAPIRGYKLYWHKSGKNWKETGEVNKKLQSPIKPIRTGTKFKGCIRFENLSNIELGALLFALDLPPGCCHKLGMGKPLGLGTIHIQSDLYLSDRKKRYQHLFAERSLELSDKKEGLIDEFDRYIRENIGANDIQNLWEHARMKELSTLLNVQTGIHLEEKNTYMSIQAKEFRDRPVLPLASEVK